ncbi:MAG: hypothetical protein EOM54_05445 [Clostridia bacterium]|nr:hypothetical protein [Clostridia bacterium]NCC69668.1 hypothetical protein [Clostridia bacterium]
MKRDKNKGDKLNTRTFGYIAGAALLLAILTVVLCAMGGVFDFDSGKEDEARITAPQQTYAVPVTTSEQTAEPTSTPEPTPAPTPETQTWTISAIAGKGGEMSPSGIVEVDEGGSVTFKITPDEGYVLSELKVDGEAVEAADTYTFRNITANHSIYAVFRLAPETPDVTGTPDVTELPSSATDIR